MKGFVRKILKEISHIPNDKRTTLRDWCPIRKSQEREQQRTVVLGARQP